MTRLAKPEGCRGCPGDDWQHPIVGTKRLTEPRTGFSASEGHGTNGVLVVGEALGANEDADGLPFRPQAQAGSLLDRVFKRLGYDRQQFRITNIVRCRPPNDFLADAPYEFQVIQHCRPYLLAEIASMKPRCILALGGTAFRELTGYEGTKEGISYVRGYVVPCVLEGWRRVPVVGAFHPSFLRQGKPEYFGNLCHDVMRAVEVARVGGEWHEWKHAVMEREEYVWLPRGTITDEPGYTTRASLDQASSFLLRVRNNPTLPLTYDIETHDSAGTDEDERQELDFGGAIEQIQFALAPGEGIVFPWRGEFIEIARKVLLCDNAKYSFYGHLFDDPRLRAAGCEFGGPFPHDLYEMWHHLQPDLPANLQFVASFYGFPFPWKHLAGVDAGFYGCCDVDAPQRILAKLPDQLRKRGLWDGYEQLVYRVRPVLDRMSDRGIPVNDERRRAFGAELDKAAADVDAEMQALVPEECRNIHPKQGYKKVPKVLDGLVQRVFKDHTDVNGPADPSGVLRWCRIEPFKPSSQQLIRYMRHRGHPVPVNIKKGRETSEARELERLAKKTHDPLYRKVIWYREVRLMKATFVDGWKPSADGRVHTTFTFAPATGQLSSRSPNIQNAPEHEKEGRDTGLADKFQRIMEAPPGYKFVSFDHKSFHALTLAWLAQDKDYERVVRLDIHSFLASQFLRLDSASKLLALKDDELGDYLKWVKKNHRAVRDTKAKRTILRWGFGSGYRSIYRDNLESFDGESEAKRMVEMLEGSFPKTVKYRKSIQFKAHYDTYLKSPFGFIRWFWDVFHFDGKTGRLVNGDQAEEAIAYLPANCAFGMMRDEALEMDERKLDDRYGLVNNVHDAWKFCCADQLVEECLHTIKPLMEAPSGPMGGLWCAVSASVGQNNAAKSEENPQGREEVDVRTAAVVG